MHGAVVGVILCIKGLEGGEYVILHCFVSLQVMQKLVLDATSSVCPALLDLRKLNFQHPQPTLTRIKLRSANTNTHHFSLVKVKSERCCLK